MRTRWTIVAVSVLLLGVVGLAAVQRKARSVAEGDLLAAERRAEELESKIDSYMTQLRAFRSAASREGAVAVVDPNPELLARLAAKEDEIATLRGQIAGQDETRQGSEDAPPAVRDRPPGRQDWMERLREEDPEEFERIQEERNQRREQMEQRASDQVEFINSIPTNALTGEYLENHFALVERIEFLTEARARIADDPDSEESRELRGEMREQFRDLRDMMEIEREALVADLASGMGLEGDEVAEFIDYLSYLNEMTSLSFGRRGGGFGGGPGGGGRGGGDRR